MTVLAEKVIHKRFNLVIQNDVVDIWMSERVDVRTTNVIVTGCAKSSACASMCSQLARAYPRRYLQNQQRAALAFHPNSSDSTQKNTSIHPGARRTRVFRKYGRAILRGKGVILYKCRCKWIGKGTIKIPLFMFIRQTIVKLVNIDKKARLNVENSADLNNRGM